MNITIPDTPEYEAARTGTIFARRERGVLRGTGADRLDLLHRLSTNGTRDLKAGEEATTILTSDKGRVVNLLRVFAFADHILMVSLNGETEKVIQWLDKYTIMDDFTVIDVSREYSVIGLYGERGRALVSALGTEIPEAGKFGEVAVGDQTIIIARDLRLSGPNGFLILVPATLEDSLVTSLVDNGAVEIGERTYETLRIEQGVPAGGHELSELYNPLEAGLTQYISFSKGCYIGQEVIARLDTYDKVQRHLVGLRVGVLPAEADAEELILRQPGEPAKIGNVTSLAFSPGLGQTIGLGYVRTQYAVPDAELEVVGTDSGQEYARATITRLPFDV